jgi:hypothetical protein
VEPTPCDTFTYGERPIVVIEGFEHVPEATLELATKGHVIDRGTIPMNSGQTMENYTTSSRYSGFYGSSGQNQLHVVVDAGTKINLGSVPPGTYDLTLKTNNIVAAVTQFKVTLPAELEGEWEEIESERHKLEAALDQIKQLDAEIGRDRAGVDKSNSTTVTDFNSKVTHYNQLVKEARAGRNEFNTKVDNFNKRLEGQPGVLLFNAPALDPGN